MSKNVVVEIVEQPTSVERFRYKSEGRHRIHPAANKCQKKYAAIRVLNYTGTVIVVVSCVTAEKPYKQHPNILVGQDCKKGVCTITFDTDETDPTVHTFKNMGIQCSRKGDICDALTERERCNVDPFKTGFGHKNDKTFRSAVRLCFQVLLRSNKSGTKPRPVYPVVSDIICSKDNLEICDISDTTSPTTGRKKIVIFCSKVSKGDIKVRFYRENANGTVEWEAWVQKPMTIHRQAAISFETPAYATHDISEPVDVLVELARPSDSRRSDPPRLFRYVSDSSNIINLIRKKLEKITKNEAFCMTEELNIEPNIPPINLHIPPMNANQYSNGCSTALPQATQSNFISNFSGNNQASIHAIAPSFPHQQTHFDSRSFSHNQMQHSAQSVYNAHGDRSQINFSQSHANQPYHSHQQHSQFQPMISAQQQTHANNAVHPSRSQFYSQNIQSAFQPLNNHQMQSNDNKIPLHPAQNSGRQSELNGYRHQQQQHYNQLIPHPMQSNPGFGGKHLTSANPYCPFPTFYNAEQMYNPVQSNMHQLAPRNNVPTNYNEQNL